MLRNLGFIETFIDVSSRPEQKTEHPITKRFTTKMSQYAKTNSDFPNLHKG